MLSMDDHQARDIARGLREGNPDAWRTLYDAFATSVWRGVARLLGATSADVADVVQETMLAAARSARSYDPGMGTLWQWLWGIARLQVALHHRKMLRHDRARQDTQRVARWLDGAEPLPSEQLEAAEVAASVRVALTELPAEYESLLTAKYLDGSTVAQIADQQKSTETAVRSKLARARDAFRSVFLRIAGDTQTQAEACHDHP
jgi:RNA polymerase sigma-70 factor (ECF subfamily)